MPTPQETAYPILKTQIPKETLENIYTPSADEIAFVKMHSHTPQNRSCMLTLLKCAQRLGYFVFLSSIPRSIPEYIAKHVRCRCSLKILSFYDHARALTSHIKKIRAYLNIKPADKKASSTALKAMEHAACTREDIVDILNVGIEELIRLHYELPKFDHLLRQAYQAKKNTNTSIYKAVNEAISEPTRNQLESAPPGPRQGRHQRDRQGNRAFAVDQILRFSPRSVFICSLCQILAFRHGGKKSQCQPCW